MQVGWSILSCVLLENCLVGVIDHGHPATGSLAAGWLLPSQPVRMMLFGETTVGLFYRWQGCPCFELKQGIAHGVIKGGSS